MFCEIIFAGCVKYPIFNLPLQYRITKNRSRLLRTEPPGVSVTSGGSSFPSIGRRNSYYNNAPNPGANCGYRRCTLCRNYRISFYSSVNFISMIYNYSGDCSPAVYYFNPLNICFITSIVQPSPNKSAACI